MDLQEGSGSVKAGRASEVVGSLGERNVKSRLAKHGHTSFAMSLDDVCNCRYRLSGHAFGMNRSLLPSGLLFPTGISRRLGRSKIRQSHTTRVVTVG